MNYVQPRRAEPDAPYHRLGGRDDVSGVPNALNPIKNSRTLSSPAAF